MADATDTSTGSFVSFRIYEQVKCITAPGDNALWFMYEPLLMSKKSFDKLDKKQQDVLIQAGKKAQKYYEDKAEAVDAATIKAYKEGILRATNVLVPVCFSASHVAYSSLRMEPQYMIIGQAAGVAAKLAIDGKKSVQEIDTARLTGILRQQGAILEYVPTANLPILQIIRRPGVR